MKKNLKSITAAVMAVCMCVTMTGCGEKEKRNMDELTEKDFEDAASELEAEFNSSAAFESTEAVNEEIKISDEILTAKMYSCKRQIGNTVFSFPLNASDLFAAGAICQDEQTPDTIIINEHTRKDVEVIMDGEVHSLIFCNETDERKLIKDCVIYNGSKNSIYPGGIKIGSTVDELINAWGEPETKDIDIYSYADDLISCGYAIKPYSATGNSYTVNIDLSTQTINSITSTMNHESDNMIPRIKTNPNNHEFSYSIPEYLMDGTYAYEFNGTTYALILSGEFTHWAKSAYVSEYSDDVLTTFFDDYSAKHEGYSYKYKINDDSVLLIERIIDEDYASVDLVYMDSDFEMNAISFEVFPCNGATEVSSEALEAVDDIIFSIGETIKVNKTGEN